MMTSQILAAHPDLTGVPSDDPKNDAESARQAYGFDPTTPLGWRNGGNYGAATAARLGWGWRTATACS